jgi:N-acylglucosamine-6-phosphate 2-epimerase
MDVLNKIRNGLIVSCQAKENSPLDNPKLLAAMAKAAEEGGAVGIRANWPRNIIEIKKNISVPIIGIYKKCFHESQVKITPTFEEAKKIIDLEIEIIALDATLRDRPNNEDLSTLVKKIRDYSNVLIMGDIATYEEAVNADRLGLDIIATTLLSYTEETKNKKAPDMHLIREITENVKIPLIVEGKIYSPWQAAEAIKAGAYAVVVGTAITDISWVTSHYVGAIKSI